MDLVIVESPTKARKLSGYLGKNFQVEASVGHVRDLPKKKLGVDVENNFEPDYEVSEDKKTVIAQLKKLAKKAKSIYLAMDPDREGEAIAWHIKYILSDSAPKSAHPKFLRATFHEITKSAVTDAIEHPGKININLVDAQQARRVLDRLVGYKVSPVLWRKVRKGLSAGRVQSVALRLIVEREKEIEAFKPEEYWELDVLLAVNKGKPRSESKLEAFYQKEGEQKPKWLDEVPVESLVARVSQVDGKKFEPKQESEAKAVVEFLNQKQTQYRILDVEKKERHKASYPPFTTSTLQQAAANKLGMTSKQTMRLAQNLYEEGLITYHRTDSFNLSQQAVAAARQYIQTEYGDSYLPGAPRIFTKKSKNAQEAHEAIRVTDVTKLSGDIHGHAAKITPRHIKLYDLIWRRFVASQMEAARYDQTSLKIAAQPEAKSKKKSAQEVLLKSTGSVLKFDGWMKLFQSQQDRILPPVEVDQELFWQDLNAAQKFTQPPPRYNDASLVKELEKRGIGRPSTYASIISVIVDRGYVERIERRFWATKVGVTVSDFLIKYFEQIMDYEFTAEMEDDLDVVANGEKDWRKIVAEFYKPFAKNVEDVIKNAKRVQVPVEKTGKKCPECGKTEEGEVVIREGRFGKFLSCSRFPECKYTENIVEKVDGVKCPLCQEGKVIVKNTRWGKQFYGCERYPECDWASWQKPEKGLKITAAEWKKMQAERAKKKKARAKKSKKKSA